MQSFASCPFYLMLNLIGKSYHYSNKDISDIDVLFQLIKILLNIYYVPVFIRHSSQ